jgi:hypothetical protein
MVKPFQSVSEKESYAAVYVVLGHRENENSEKYFCSFVNGKCVTTLKYLLGLGCSTNSLTPTFKFYIQHARA